MIIIDYLCAMNFDRTLNLPAFAYRVRSLSNGQEEIFDSQRNKYVRLTPEEWVRQHFVNYLVNYCGFPKGRIGNEVPIKVGLTEKRCDSVVFDEMGKPKVIVEYKASSVALTRKVFDQIARYNLTLKVDYLIVSNGLTTYCCRMNRTLGRFEFLESIPNYPDL